MGFSVDQLSGLVSTTLSELGRGKVTDLASDLQDYVVMSKLLDEHKIQFDGGESAKFNVTATLGQNARHVGLYETDNVNVDDSHATGEVPWRFTETSYAFDRREKQLNSPKPEQIVNLIKLRRGREIGGLAELMETTFWGKPDSSTDKTTPFGLFYWVVTTTGKTAYADCGFNGGDPSGFSSGAGGLDVATYGNWKNWAGNYTNVTKDDLIKKMRKAGRNTKFRSPIKHPNYDTSGVSQRFQIYVNESTISDMEDLGEDQNENLGRDLAAMDGLMTFRKNPIIYDPQLDNESANPVYMINWGVFGVIFLAGEWMRETVKAAPNQHNVVQVFVDLSWNTKCEDRRKQAVLNVV